MVKFLDMYAMALSILVGGVGFGMTYFFNTNVSEWGAEEMAYPAMAMIYVYVRNARFDTDKSKADNEREQDSVGGTGIPEALPSAGQQRKAPSFDVPNVKLVEGESLTSSPEGQLIAVLFFATWCSNSEKCLPGFSSTATRYRQEGIRFAAVTQEGEDDLRYFINGFHRPLRSITFLSDEQGVLHMCYQGAFGQGTLPHCYIVRGGASRSATGKGDMGLGTVVWHGHPTRLEGALEFFLDDSDGTEAVDERVAAGRAETDTGRDTAGDSNGTSQVEATVS